MNQTGIDKAREYGLSEEDPLTFEWVTDHPKEMLEIKKGMENYGAVIMDGVEIDRIREKMHLETWEISRNLPWLE